jgi:hypothetical protein
MLCLKQLSEIHQLLGNLQTGNKSKRFKHHTCYEGRKVYGMLACVSYDMRVSISFQISKVVDDEMYILTAIYNALSETAV